MATWQAPKSFRDRPVTVLGGGVLGRRIAACWCAGGWTVHIRDPSAAQREAAVQYVNDNMGVYTRLTQRSPANVVAFEDLAKAVENAWLVIEAVPEKLEIKIATFADLERYAPADSVLASNSSSYKTSQMLDKVGSQTKNRILNTHYMMPPKALIVELMTDGHTAQEIFPFLIDRHREAGLHPIVALKESTGFVFNRIWAAIKRETLKVIREGVATPDTVDAVFMEQYGAKQGPCRLMDNVGLDTVSLIEQHYVDERHIDHDHLDWLNKNFVQAGKLGNKTAEKGGLYPPPEPGTQTELIFLNIGMAEPYEDKLSAQDLMHRGSIVRLNVDSGAPAREILSHEAMPDGIDTYGDRLFWTDMGIPAENDGTIYSANLDGSDIKTVIPTGNIHTPKQLIVAAWQKKIYWADREGMRISRANFDGSEHEVLVQNGDWQVKIKDQTHHCVGVAVSEKLQKVFWTQKGAPKSNEGRIFCAGLDTPADPAARKDIELIADRLPEPIDLEFDDEKGVLYWTDRGELPLGNTLNKKTIIGSQPESERKLGRQILAQNFGEAIGLKLDRVKDCIWVNDISGHIWKCNPNRLAPKEKVYESGTGAFTGLTFIRV